MLTRTLLEKRSKIALKDIKLITVAVVIHTGECWQRDRQTYRIENSEMHV